MMYFLKKIMLNDFWYFLMTTLDITLLLGSNYAFVLTEVDNQQITFLMQPSTNPSQKQLFSLTTTQIPVHLYFCSHC